MKIPSVITINVNAYSCSKVGTSPSANPVISPREKYIESRYCSPNSSLIRR